MLRKFTYNKIFRTSGMLILFLLLLLFPASHEYSLSEERTATVNKSISQSEIFLIDKNNYVSKTKIDVSKSNDVSYVKKLVEILVIDGKYSDLIPNGFKAILPSDTKINNVEIKNDSVIIDFSNDVLELTDKDFEKVLETLTYNLTMVDNISNVYLRINGREINEYPVSKKILKQPLTRQIGINKKHNETSIKNASLTTIYFIGKNNNSTYYVPVTEIDNDQEDKIKIIVNELTSSRIYESNLMSYLNYNTKLIDYKINDDILTLNFNDFIFDDKESKTILEEVIYSISLSVKENYDVNEVVFNVEGNEITKSVLKNIE